MERLKLFRCLVYFGWLDKHTRWRVTLQKIQIQKSPRQNPLKLCDKTPKTKPPSPILLLWGQGGDCSFNSVEFCLYIMVQILKQHINTLSAKKKLTLSDEFFVTVRNLLFKLSYLFLDQIWYCIFFSLLHFLSIIIYRCSLRSLISLPTEQRVSMINQWNQLAKK